MSNVVALKRTRVLLVKMLNVIIGELLGLVFAFGFSVTDKSQRALAEAESFGAQWIRSEIGPVREKLSA